MRAVLQRVLNAKVEIGGDCVSQISKGFMILLGVESEDTSADAAALARKIAGLRVFADDNDKMNLSLEDVGGEVLVVSNFTLCADCRKGRRPNFERAARGESANTLYELFCDLLKENGVNTVAKGVFGADMQVSIVNDGPVTIIIDSSELAKC